MYIVGMVAAMGQLEVVIRELVQCYYRESIKEVTNFEFVLHIFVGLDFENI